MPDRHSQTLNKSTDLLIKDEDSEIDQEWYEGDRLNMVPDMDPDEKREAIQFINDRVDTAVEQTNDMRKVMKKADKQYKGEWQSKEADADEDIYLPMTREDINSVRAYLISILAQLIPIVRMQPSGMGTIWSEIDQDIKRSKLSEAMFNYYWKDIWKAVDDIMPRFITHFLKYPMGILKLGYYETNYNPDLILEVIDRGFLYIDPRANSLKEAGWVAHEYYIPRSEVFARVDRGDWHLTELELSQLTSVQGTVPNSIDMERYFGKNRSQTTTLTEDELIQCVDYWQFPRQGLDDMYCTIVGNSSSGNTVNIVDGVLARYGHNPFPSKGNPFIGASFNPDDRPDGQSMAMLQEPFQRVANTLYNIRVADLRKNVRAATFMLEEMVDDQTIEDIREGRRIVRAAKTFSEFIHNNPGARMGDFIEAFPSGTSTAEVLIQDLQFILSMGQKSANTPDVFRGLDAQPGATLGQIQEQLSRTTGQFTPITRSMMRIIENVAEGATAFFRSEDFYPEERIIRIIGKNNYKDTLEGWFVADQNTAYKSVSADDVDVDMIFDAVSGADMISSKTLLMTTFERVMQSFGQIPQMFEIVSKDVNFSAYFKQIINVNGFDVEGLLYTDREKEENERKLQEQAAAAEEARKQQQVEAFQMQQAMLEMQSRIKMMEEQQKQLLMGQKQIAIDQSRAMTAADMKAEELETQHQLKEEEMEKQADLDATSAAIQNELDKDKMNHEADLESEALARGDEISVGRDSDNVVLSQTTEKS
jgi:hypothetical protein